MDDDAAAAAAAADLIVDEDLLVPVRGSDEDDENNSSAEQLLVASEAGVSEATPAAVVAAANVDSECESDDEWNYVKPKEQAVEDKDLLTEEPQPEKEAIQEEKHDDHENQFEAAIHEQHAEAQAIAETQEHCAEVSGRGLIKNRRRFFGCI